ncbi:MULTISPECIES: ATP-dependent helicase [unclassified Mucilaginibacter]|uniref:ATP-dependent helicase n=1 Tax=unclassified Mucilaginibacter TaxID=2617802 RepID=UPI00095F5702|nr:MULTISPECIES: UvrD-helicase domain-containing protein [unclassified Mucilaginibacter]OJW16993.1 MAG: ATP-dependent DNA helicase [Mucilaginibacter sp. 44-25]PLW91409.1 MAG: ATP-dependent DNA helicase [Mucilaginibacter sp.]HEK20560.1 ATP-dependent DNA helicase [Bacteroidota bacterium]
MDYLQGLNPEQKAAVLQIKGPVMIIAGAGSGKTRVITYRVAHLIRSGVDSFNILVLTFTNKAAKEMRERINHIVGPEAKNIWMGTFHSVFAKILRVEADRLGYPSNFTIYDTDDSKSVLRAILKEMQLDDKLYAVNFVLNRISAAKSALLTPVAYQGNPQIQAEDDSQRRPLLGKIYETYAQRCYRAGAMDFDDLLLKTNELLRDHADVRNKYQHKFKYIMVDEYQDTNHSQYSIVKRLASVNENLCVVGDDAQSIYAFRGANIQNILNFEKDYPDLKVFKLEQNYRSTQNIVNVANSIIANNKDQLKKNVFSEKDTGDKIKVMRAFSDNEEGKMVADAIMHQRSTKSLKWKDFAILYRTNAQSRSMEEALRKLNIPYKIYGGMSFYQRKEIKDLIAYFRLTFNPNDEEALKRVINYPKRGIGDTTVDRIIVAADKHQLTPFEVILEAPRYVEKAPAALTAFATMIQSFQVITKTLSAYDAALHIAQHSGLLKDLYDDKSVEGLNRYENIQELLNGIKEFSEREDIEEKGLDVFMQDVALLTNDDNDKNKDADTVSLMTIHSSKGLEFPQVHIVGLEENLFPSQMSLNSRSDLEEERRLFYVAITRAEYKLTISYATSRFKFGTLINCEPSRFLDEIDAKYLELDFSAKPAPSPSSSFGDERSAWSRKPADTFSKPKPATAPPVKTTSILAKAHVPSAGFKPADTSNLQVGMEVEHERFGFGKVISLEGNKPDIKATIFFKEIGQKQLLLKFAKLSIVT